jgi:hypothetical protein
VEVVAMKKTVKIILLHLDVTIVIGVTKIQMPLNVKTLQELLQRAIWEVVALGILGTT